MPLDIVDLRSFYGSPLGQVSRRLIGRTMRGLWPDLKGLSLAGIGYATPCLPLFRGEAAGIIALMPATQGVVNWPGKGPSATALIDPFEIPLPNASIDRIILMHALEMMAEPVAFLSEIWRVLNPGGRVIAVVPNRRGVWAQADTTPFGQGHPYSRGQLADEMRLALFSPENWIEALYLPPLQRRLVLRSAGIWESMGKTLSLPFSGVHIVDATKQLYRPALTRPVRRGFVIAAPSPVASG